VILIRNVEIVVRRSWVEVEILAGLVYPIPRVREGIADPANTISSQSRRRRACSPGRYFLNRFSNALFASFAFLGGDAITPAMPLRGPLPFAPGPAVSLATVTRGVNNVHAFF
jgi:hypothetical protein